MTIEETLEQLNKRDATEKEFLQAVKEVFSAVKLLDPQHPEYALNGIYQRIVEPERVIMFRIPWVNDQNEVVVNRGYRVQFNSALGPYKGGLRFHKSVNLSVIKFLAFEQIFKNALTGLMMGGGKGGSDFDPHGKSDGEIMRFCQSFMAELSRHIGPHTDVPAGDIGVGAREIGYLFGAYKKYQNRFEGSLTGKDYYFGGSLARKEATGYGLCYFMEKYLNDHDLTFKGRTVIISGSGNVALYALQKVTELGGKVVAMSDSDGYILNPEGIAFATLREIKENRRQRIKAYIQYDPKSTYHEDPEGLWEIPCDIALPCATQNEVDLKAVTSLVKNGLKALGEGANMPCTAEAIAYLIDHDILFGPAKAANAGGVAVSGLEMSQDALFSHWTFEQVDGMLKDIMEDIYAKIAYRAKEYHHENNLLLGANIESFIKVADAMLKQGVV